MKRIALLCLLSVIWPGAVRAHAETITLTASDSGWYTRDGVHQNWNENYYVTTSDASANYRNNWFVFDRSLVTGPIVSATLALGNPSPINIGMQSTFTLFDVSTPIATLVSGSDTGALVGQAIHADLESGLVYGSTPVAAGSSQRPGIVYVDLNQNGLIALNLADGKFAVGGALSSSGAAHLFAGTHAGSRQLILETAPVSPVPEPASMLLLGTGLVGVGMRRWRQKRA